MIDNQVAISLYNILPDTEKKWNLYLSRGWKLWKKNWNFSFQTLFLLYKQSVAEEDIQEEAQPAIDLQNC